MSTKMGSTLESRVARILGKLVSAGLARNLQSQDRVRDSNGCIRKIDFSMTLCTNLVEIDVTIECKYKTKPLSLDDIDQIKTYKRELPERNIFWLVYEGSLSDNVREALKNLGISAYSVDELRAIVDDRIAKYGIRANPIAASRVGKMFHLLMTDVGYIPLSDEVRPFLAALDADDPERVLIDLLIELKNNGGTMREAEDILDELRYECGDDATCDLIDHVRDDYIDWERGLFGLQFDYEQLMEACKANSQPESSARYLIESSSFWRDLARRYDLIKLIQDGQGDVIRNAIDEYLSGHECRKRYIFSNDFDEAFVKNNLADTETEGGKLSVLRRRKQT